MNSRLAGVPSRSFRWMSGFVSSYLILSNPLTSCWKELHIEPTELAYAPCDWPQALMRAGKLCSVNCVVEAPTSAGTPQYRRWYTPATQLKTLWPRVAFQKQCVPFFCPNSTKPELALDHCRDSTQLLLLHILSPHEAFPIQHS